METFEWIKTNKETREKNLLAWVHTHVNGSLLEYSSIDVHNDYMIQEFVDPNVMGIVVQLTRRSAKWDAFTLTSGGKESVKECSKNFNLAKIQHPFCCGKELKILFESCKDLVEEIDGDVKLLDYRNSENPTISNINFKKKLVSSTSDEDEEYDGTF